MNGYQGKTRTRYGHRYGLILAVVVFLSACAGMYFRNAGEPPSPPSQLTLAEWPDHEYWTGIVFNGSKIGFTHLLLSPAADAPDRFEILTEAALSFRLLMVEKRVMLKSYDRVADDLSLERFAYDYDLDGNRLKLSGRIRDGKLEVDIHTQGNTSRQTIPLTDELYPTSVIHLYPALHGLEVGRRYSYQVYDGETQTVDTVTQSVLAYEESDLFPGKAFKVKTRLHGQKTTTWIDGEGRPLLEMALRGVLISGLESEEMAKRYLTQAALNKADLLLDFSLVKSDISIRDPGEVTFMEVIVSGIDQGFAVPTDRLQRCERRGEEVTCQISTPGRADTGERDFPNPVAAERYLQSSFTVPSRNEAIRTLAGEIAGDAKGTLAQIRALVEWMEKHIKREAVDVFTAMDVLSGRKAECQGHTFLYAAFARALEIPTRVVNGIVYSSYYQGFLYHTWAESLVKGGWVPVDPTLGQVRADATHLKLLEGERSSDLLPLVDVIGRLEIRIVTVDRF